MLLLLLACADADLKLDDEPAEGDTATLTVDGPAALDPLLGTATFSLARSGGDIVTVAIHDASGAPVRTLVDSGAWVDSVTWDGRNDAGALVSIGTYSVFASLEETGTVVAEAATPAAVVRIGVTSGTLGGDDRIPLVWHADGRRGNYWEAADDSATFSLAAIDQDGVAATIPAPWDDLYAPPDDLTTQNLPAAYPWDARPTLSLVVGGDATALEPGALTAAIDGWTLTAGEATPGSTLTFTKDTALATGPRVVEETLTLRWRVGEDDVGTQAVPLRIYALLGPPAFEEEGAPYLPWVAVIDPALRAIDGVEPTQAAVISGLVEHIYRDLGLSYDTQWGASAYTQYDGRAFDNAHIDLSGFLDRTRGSIVNCTDCAAILEAFANMVGAALEYTIITPSFGLNYIQAIGADTYTQCPFGSGGCGFSYHAVTTPDGGATIYDATLALDGDTDPGASPSTELLVQAITGEEYLDRLVSSGDPSYRFTQKETLQ